MLLEDVDIIAMVLFDIEDMGLPLKSLENYSSDEFNWKDFLVEFLNNCNESRIKKYRDKANVIIAMLDRYREIGVTV